MAERTVNVNINYNVKTLEIEKLAQASMRAEQATNRLQQSTTQFGQQSSHSYKFAARSIEGMEVELARLRQQIKLVGIADTQRLRKLSTDYRSASKQLEDFRKQYLAIEKANKQVAQSTTNTANQFNQLFTAVKLVFTAGIVKQAVDMSLNMARLAGNVEGVERAFVRAFPNADSILANLRRSTHGTIGDLQLMQRTLKASNLGVDVNKLGVLFEFAASRAQQTGESVDYLVDSVVNGIGRKSILVLDNLGISANRLKEEFNGATLASQSTAEVTAAVARIAQEEMDKMGGFVETAATKVDQLAVSWENLRETFAKKFEDGGLAEFLKDYVDAFQTLLEAQNRGIEVSELLHERERERVALYETETFLKRNLTGEREKDIKFLEETIHTTQKEILQRNNLIASQNQMLEGMKKERAERKGASLELQIQGQEEIQFRKNVIAELMDEMQHRQEWLKIYLQQLRTLKQTNDDRDRELGLIEKLEKAISEVQERIKTATVQGTIFDGSGNMVRATAGSIAALNRQLAIMQGRLADLKKSGLPEFISPEVIERIGKVLDEEVKEGAADAGLEFLRIEETIARIDQQLRNMPKDPISFPPPVVPKDYADLVGEAFEDARLELITGNIDITNEFLQSSLQAEVESYRLRIDELRTFYDDQIALAGDNERRKDQLRIEEARRVDRLRRQTAQKEKEARRFSIIIDTAASIAKSAIVGFPAAIPFILLAIANGAAQLAALNRAQIRGFAKGEVGIDGPGNGRSDSIPAMLSKGESIINSDATKRSYNLLEAINAKKIDDRVLKDLRVTGEGVKVVGINDKRIVEAIKGQQQVDVVRIGSQLYEVKNRTATYKRYIRSKSMGK